MGTTATIQIVGSGKVNDRTLVRVADKYEPLQVASVIPPPDLVVIADRKEVTLEPGKEVTLSLRIQRKNGLQGRVPCRVMNLPPGVRVVNIGLNGVLVHPGQDSASFTLRAEDWAPALEQPIYIVGMVESNSPTDHASAPLTLKVRATEVASTTGVPAAHKRCDPL